MGREACIFGTVKYKASGVVIAAYYLTSAPQFIDKPTPAVVVD